MWSVLNCVEAHLGSAKADVGALDEGWVFGKLSEASSLIREMKTETAGGDEIVWRAPFDRLQRLVSTSRAMAAAKRNAEPGSATGNTLALPLRGTDGSGHGGAGSSMCADEAHEDVLVGARGGALNVVDRAPGAA